MTEAAQMHSPRQTEDRANWTGVALIAAGTFLMVMTEFLPIGLLSQFSAELGVTEGIAGLAVTMPGIVAMIAAPGLALIAGRIDRKILIFLLTLSFVVSNLIAASAPNFLVFLIGRTLLGIGVGGLWAFAVAAGRKLVPDTSGGRATSIISAGISLGTIVGVPAGTLIGSATGWRMAFAGAAVLGLLIVALQLRFLPRLPVQVAMTGRRMLAILKVPMARTGLAAIMFIAAGHFIAYTFLEPFLREMPRFGNDGVASVLAGYALAGLLGTYLGERLAAVDVRMALTTGAALVGIAVLCAATFGATGWLAAITVLVWGLAFGSVPVIIQIWMHHSAPSLYEGSAAVLVSIFQVGLSAGALVGGMLIDGPGIQMTFWIGGSVAIFGAAIALLLGGARSQNALV